MKKQSNMLLYIFLAIIVLIILAASFIPVSRYIDGQLNKKVIVAYVNERYGDDYEIVDERLGKAGADGRHDDRLTIRKNGITFDVYAKDRVIVRDTFDE